MQPEQPSDAPTDAQTLVGRAVRGGAWMAFGTGTTTLLQLATFLVLYRLLVPEDFGLMALVTAVAAMAAVVADAGLTNAIIWRQDLTRDQLASLYWLNVAGGVVLAALLAALSPVLAWAFGNAALMGLLACFSVTLAITAAGQQFVVLLRRDLHFRTLALVNAAGATVGSATAIALALVGWGVWSLVVGAIARETVRLGFLLAVGLRRWRPAWHFRRQDLRGVMSFGLYQVGSRSITAVRNQLDTLIIAALVNETLLGCYDAVRKWVLFPLSRLNPVISTVAFPSFARVQDDDALLRAGYLKVIHTVSLVAAPVLAGLFAVAPAFVEVVYGPTFKDHRGLMVILVRVLCLLGLGRSLANPMGSLVLAKGRADVGFWVSLVMAVLALGGLVVGAQWGVVGVAWAQVGVVVVLHGIGAGIRARLVDLSSVPWLQAAARSVAIAAAMGTGVWGIGEALVGLTPLWRLVVQAMVGVVLYTLSTVALDRRFVGELWASLRAGRAGETRVSG